MADDNYDDNRFSGKRKRSITEDDESSTKFRKLFVGGLSYDTSDEALKAYFEEWGDVVDCIVMKEPGTKRSRGFGFVTYRDSKMLDDCQSCRPHTIDGRNVDTKRAMPKTAQTQVQPGEKREPSFKLFVGGIRDISTKDTLKTAFEKFGTVTHVELMMDNKTGRHRGFAFITFEDSDSTDKAVIARLLDVDSKTVEIKRAESKQNTRFRGNMNMMGNNMGGGMGMSMSNKGGSGKNNMGMGMSSNNMGNNNMGMNQMGMGMNNMGNNMGMNQMGNNMGMNQMGMNNMGMGMNNMGMGMNNMGMGMNNMGMNQMGNMGMNQMGMNNMGMNQMGMNNMGNMGMNQMGMNQMGMNNMGNMGMNQMGINNSNMGNSSSGSGKGTSGTGSASDSKGAVASRNSGAQAITGGNQGTTDSQGTGQMGYNNQMGQMGYNNQMGMMGNNQYGMMGNNQMGMNQMGQMGMNQMGQMGMNNMQGNQMGMMGNQMGGQMGNQMGGQTGNQTSGGQMGNQGNNQMGMNNQMGQIGNSGSMGYGSQQQQAGQTTGTDGSANQAYNSVTPSQAAQAVYGGQGWGDGTYADTSGSMLKSQGHQSQDTKAFPSKWDKK